MSARKHLVRWGAALAAVLVTAALAMLAASPARAAEVTARVSNLPSSFVAGGQGRSFSVTVERGRLDPLTRALVVIVELDGLSPSQVAIGRAFGGDLPLSGSGGQVRGTDQGPFITTGTLRTTYRLRFGQDAPLGRARVLVEAYAGTGQLLARSSARSTSVRSLKGNQNTTRPATILPGSNGSTYASAPEAPGQTFSPLVEAGNGGPQVDGGGVITLPFYLLGGALVIGGAIVLWLLLGRNREQVVADTPTMMLPTVRPQAPYGDAYQPAPTQILIPPEHDVPPLPKRPRHHRPG